MKPSQTTFCRAEAMRMHDEGASIGGIADWLGMQRGEVRRFVEEESLKRAKAAQAAHVPVVPTLSPVLELALCRPWRAG